MNVCGSDDEYVPGHVNIATLASRIASAIGLCAASIVLPGDHALKGSEEAFAKLIALFVSQETGEHRAQTAVDLFHQSHA